VSADDAFRALADPTRRAILDLLRDGERTAGDLGAAFPVSQPAMSQHLRVLREAGLVTQRPEGARRWYRIDPVGLRAVYDWLEHYEHFWDERLLALGRHLDDTDTEEDR
jgi:DNA-binding transcriptional ArsR family regulator